MDIKTRNRYVEEGLKYLDIELKKIIGRYNLRKYMYPEDIEDMRSDCIIEMIRYIEDFDPTRDVKLRTYLTPRIHGFFIDSLRKMSKIRNKESEYAVEKISQSVLDVFKLPQKQAETVFDSYNLTSENVKELYIDLYEQGVLPNQTLYQSMMELSDRRIYILLSFYILNKSIKEISDNLGFSVTSGWVYKMHRQCLSHLKEKLTTLGDNYDSRNDNTNS